MKQTLKALAMNPMAYVIGFGVFGAISISAGIGLCFGIGYSLVSLGAFSIGASAYVSRGMRANG